jgi:hypothetical protein
MSPWLPESVPAACVGSCNCRRSLGSLRLCVLLSADPSDVHLTYSWGEGNAGYLL